MRSAASRHWSLVVPLLVLAGCGGPDQERPGGEGEELGQVRSAMWEEPYSLYGLLGSYARSSYYAAPEELLSMTLTGVETASRVDGHYYRRVKRTCYVTGCDTERGTFTAVPSNAAVGPLIGFSDEAGNARDSYAILKIQRSYYTGKITALFLQKMSTPDAQPFTMYRVSSY